MGDKLRNDRATHDWPGLFGFAQSPARVVLAAKKNAVSNRRSFILSGISATSVENRLLEQKSEMKALIFFEAVLDLIKTS
jgi:hypothetical protein